MPMVMLAERVVKNMLSKKIIGYLDDLVKTAEKKDYKIESITFYNTYIELPEADKTPDTLLEMQEYLNGKNIEILSDGVELEETIRTIPADEMVKPFDPTKINIVMVPMALESLVKRLKNEEVDLNTAFQRKAGLWSKEKKSQLIESLLLRIPLPAFYFDACDDGKWLIIDGLQRITAFYEFIVSKTLKLEGMEFFGDLNGLGYDELPRQFARRIDESSIIAYTVKEGTPQNVKYNIFKRLNTGGLELEPQEIRHALYQGRSVSLLKKLAMSTEFLEATCRSIRTERMLDQEFVLRFIAVCYYGHEKYDGIPENFLNMAMEYTNQLSEIEIDRIEKEFLNIMSIMTKIFGNAAFRKMALDGRRRPINKAIYEMWCRVVFELSMEKRERLVIKKDVLQRGYVALCDRWDFQGYVRASDKYSYMKRLSLLQGLVEEVLRDNTN